MGSAHFKENSQGCRDSAQSCASIFVGPFKEIELSGPIRGNWPNYGKLGKGRHHCHLKKGAPTYVAVWEVKTGRVKLVEVIYAGTHEKAPY